MGHINTLWSNEKKEDQKEGNRLVKKQPCIERRHKVVHEASSINVGRRTSGHYSRNQTEGERFENHWGCLGKDDEVN